MRDLSCRARHDLQEVLQVLSGSQCRSFPKGAKYKYKQDSRLSLSLSRSLSLSLSLSPYIYIYALLYIYMYMYMRLLKWLGKSTRYLGTWTLGGSKRKMTRHLHRIIRIQRPQNGTKKLWTTYCQTSHCFLGVGEGRRCIHLSCAAS